MKIGYENLTVWQESFELAYLIYKLTRQFPSDERFGLTSQMRRCAVSISSNIAEGKGRLSDAELNRFCLISYGSAMELRTQLRLSKRLELAPQEAFILSEQTLERVLRLLNAFMNKLQRKGN